MKNHFIYFYRLLSLWGSGKISFHTVRRAIRERPLAVCGKGGAFVIDPSTDEDYFGS